MTPRRKDDKAETESRRILERVGRESESSMLGRVRDHVTANDVRKDDPVELWGTRIGRTIAVTVLVALIAWLFYYVFGG
ncbi:hypothetical protein [Nitratireductor sp. ZSWI3]|uniref:hypothetical protein n=1 Tax=Nitratireductor sp. ZSWI3 TaxID=2966359 RepID=UPI00214FBE46|nr:hypothetical protein [Nitratireductor sp. ZSWI3]MCR4265633.1 hypothetical protein [Nitratireductor sp. ZSWI3]